MSDEKYKADARAEELQLLRQLAKFGPLQVRHSASYDAARRLEGKEEAMVWWSGEVFWAEVTALGRKALPIERADLPRIAVTTDESGKRHLLIHGVGVTLANVISTPDGAPQITFWKIEEVPWDTLRELAAREEAAKRVAQEWAAKFK